MEFVIEPDFAHNYKKLYCSEGHYITRYNEGDDILTFQASRLIYCPMSVDVENIYHCITDEEFERLDKLRDEAENPILPEETEEEITEDII